MNDKKFKVKWPIKPSNISQKIKIGMIIYNE